MSGRPQRLRGVHGIRCDQRRSQPVGREQVEADLHAAHPGASTGRIERAVEEVEEVARVVG